MNGKINQSAIVNKLMNTESKVIHFSTHAEVDSNDYLNSGLVLSNGHERLSIKIISKMRINSQMVFLNSCNSASFMKKRNFSESICAAFLKAGASSCIGTLWKIDDRVASNLAIEFYKEVRKGKRSAEALRLAKLKYIENTNLRSEKHPYHWAGFQVYGENERILDVSRSKIQTIFSLVFSLLTSISMLVYYFGYKLKKLALHNNWI